ncbi:hypothetical protein IJG89_00545 [Candidatus Saccharibacteria bacterium]|nr:hypothetical protein [Candidatus Saccharibacteria bacterium]
MPKKSETGTFFDIDPENWGDYVDHARDSDDCHRDGKKKKKKAKVSHLPDIDPTPYWEACLNLVNAWADYQKVKKLLINAQFDETEHKVRPVVDGYWGDINKLQCSVDERSQLVDSALRCHELLCSRYGVEPVSRDWLYHRLLGAKDYASYRGKIQRRKARYKEPVSLKKL